MKPAWREHALTAAVALAAWGGAGAVWLASGHVSVVLLAAPLAWALADATLDRRATRLAARVAREFRDLEAEGGADFDGASAQVLAQRARLFGVLPPRLVELRLVRSPAGALFLVRAELRDAAAPVAWRVTRLNPDEAQRWQRELA